MIFALFVEIFIQTETRKRNKWFE